MKQLIILLVLCVSLASAFKFLDGNPTCGTYGPQWWLNNGMTLQYTLQLGAPISPLIANQPFFFGCTPNSTFSHAYNHTVFFTYFDGASPNDNLVQVSEAHDSYDLGRYYMQYNDSQGDGNVAVITEANLTPQGGGRANLTYSYNNYIIESLHARNEWFSVLSSLIGQDETKEVRPLSQLRRRTTLVSKVLNAMAYMPEPDRTKTVVHTSIAFLYNSAGQVRKEVVKVNTTEWDNELSNDNVTYTDYDFKYKFDNNGNIIQVRTFQDGTAVSQSDFTYDPDTGLLVKACQNGCANYREIYVYDDDSRVTEVHFDDGTEWKFKYDGADDQVSTADFGTDYGLFTFNY